jgi:hypothetical protein
VQVGEEHLWPRGGSLTNAHANMPEQCWLLGVVPALFLWLHGTSCPAKGTGNRYQVAVYAIVTMLSISTGFSCWCMQGGCRPLGIPRGSFTVCD